MVLGPRLGRARNAEGPWPPRTPQPGPEALDLPAHRPSHSRSFRFHPKLLRKTALLSAKGRKGGKPCSELLSVEPAALSDVCAHSDCTAAGGVSRRLPAQEPEAQAALSTGPARGGLRVGQGGHAGASDLMRGLHRRLHPTAPRAGVWASLCTPLLPNCPTSLSPGSWAQP